MEMVKLDQQAVTQAGLLREAKADEGNYLLYLGKREQERTSDALDQKRIANVAIAVPAVTPVLPKYSPLLVMLLGLIAGFIFAIGAVYIMEYIDPSFRTPQEGRCLALPRVPMESISASGRNESSVCSGLTFVQQQSSSLQPSLVRIQ